ncbi:MAG: iron-sulfur cluster assembly scaffold protein [Candidatus Andersenbacteria bacterium]
MDIYRDHLLDHYYYPRGWGLTSAANREERGVNMLCGDELMIQLQVEGMRVESMRFEGHGCVISRASASLLAEQIGGWKVKAVQALTLADIQSWLGVELPPVRIACALLAIETVQRALQREKTS